MEAAPGCGARIVASPEGWRRRRKPHKTSQMGGSLAGQEEERGGPGRRSGTCIKGALSALSRGLPEAAGWSQAPGAACPRPRGHAGSAWAQSSLPVPGRARRWGWGCARRLSGALRTAPRAGRSRRGGRAGRASLGANLPHPGAAPESGAPGAEIPGVRERLCSSRAERDGAGASENQEVCLSSKSPDLAAEVRLEPKASDSRAAGRPQWRLSAPTLEAPKAGS